MQEVYRKASKYALENQYNMDEIGLYWQWWPDIGLATSQLPGFKKAKKRVSLTIYYSGTGEKLPLWIIRTAKRPRAFKGIDIQILGYQ